MIADKEFIRVFHSSPVPMSLSRISDGTFTLVNSEFSRISGHTVKEIVGKTALELGIWADPSQRDHVQRLILRNGMLRNHELDVITKTGEKLTVLWSVDQITFEAEPHLLISAYDITARKRNETALGEREVLFRSIVDSAPVGMYFYEIEDGELILKAANPASERVTRIKSAELIGKSIQEAFPPLADTDIPAQYKAVARTGRPWSRSSVQYDTAESSAIYDIHAFQTGPDKMCVMFSDVSERIRAEEERKILEDRLRIAQKMEAIGHLAGGIAHDFNNLLSPIMGYTELVLTGDEVTASTRRDLTEVMRAAERAKALINQLLAFSRKQVLEVKTVDLCSVIGSFMNVLRHTIREEIDLEIDKRIECGCVHADVGQIEQILLNLAINAQDAIEASGAIKISLDRREYRSGDLDESTGLSPGAYVVLSVRDTGSGIGEDVLQRLFEPFFTTKSPGKGTGLGLSTVYGIIQQHRGSITAANNEDGGAIFSVFLPEVPDCGETAGSSKESISSSPGTGCILLVEDDKMVREMTQRMLESKGYRVISSDDTSHAITIFESGSYTIDLMLTDVVMPGMSGKEIYQKLSAIDPELKVLYMSGYENSVLGERGVLEEGVNFIQKPFTLPRLVDKIQSIIGVQD